MHVRRARTGDLAQVNKLTIGLHNDVGRLLGARLSAKELEDERFKKGDLRGLFVAVDNGVVVGYAHVGRREEDEWCGEFRELTHIMVCKRHRNKGVGRALFAAVDALSRKEGTNIKTITNTANKKAISFYRSLGFKPLELGMLLQRKRRMRL